MPDLTTPIDNLAPDHCVCECPYDCTCLPGEKALHFIIAGGASLNPEQREWCLTEIAKVKGHRREDYAEENDAQIACGVLDAWIDYCYCRDKGIL